MKALFVSFILPAALLLGACAKNDSILLEAQPAPGPEPVQLDRQYETRRITPQSFNPTLEILFVLDNSTSMKDELDKLSENINRFVDGFTRNTPFRYRVAVTSVYDTRRFTSNTFKERFGGTDKDFDVGEFRPVKNRQGQVIPDKYFITSEDDDVAGLLKNTLKIGVEDHRGAGPEVEESFTPIAAAYGFGPKQRAKTIDKQKGFFFQDKDSYKIVFIVTDASDNSLMSASELHTGLMAHSNGDRSKVMGFGALSGGGDGCQEDPGHQNDQIRDFLDMARPDPTVQNIVSLCSSFGDKFARFGELIRKTILDQSIALTQGKPDVSNANAVEVDPATGESINECDKPRSERSKMGIVVCYGTQRIFLRTATNGIAGYRINTDTDTIRLDPNFNFDPSQLGAELTVDYTPIHPESLRRGNVRAYGR